MSKKHFVSTLSFFLLLSVTLAQNCEAFLEHGLYNVEAFTSSQDFDRYKYDQLCQDNFSINNLSTEKIREYGGTLGIPGIIDIGGNVSRGDVQERFEESRKQFCDTNEERLKNVTGSSTEVRTLVNKALDVYNNCLALEAGGLEIDMQVAPRPSAATTVTFGLLSPRGDLELTGVAINPKDAFSCTGQIKRPNGEVKNTEFNDETNTVLNNHQVSFTCRRNMSNSNIYEEATISITTNSRNLSSSFQRIPPLPEIQSSNARQLELRILQLESSLTQVLSTINSLESSNNNLTSNLDTLKNSVNYWESNWMEIKKGETLTLNHNLGEIPDIITILVSEDSSGNEVFMGGDIWTLQSSELGRGVIATNVTANSLNIRAGGRHLFDSYLTTGGVNRVLLDNGYVKVLLSSSN